MMRFSMPQPFQPVTVVAACCMLFLIVVSTTTAGQPSVPPSQANASTKVLSTQAQVSLITNVTIAANVDGEVSLIDVVEGTEVKLGTRLIQLEDSLARAELASSHSALEAAQLQASSDVDARYAQRTLEVGLREYEQSHSANQQYRGTVSETELAQMNLVVDQSRLAIEQAILDQRVAAANAAEQKAVVDAAEVRLRKHRVTAPHSGLIAEVMVQVGQYVELGQPMIRLIVLDPMKVECLIAADQVSEIAKGSPVIYRWGEGYVSSGEITYVSPEIHPVTGQVRLTATVRNPNGKLRPGTRGQLETSGH